MKGKKKLNAVTVITASVLILQIAELILNICGLELRTVPQEVKGVYVWLIAPLLLLICVCRLILKKVESIVVKSLAILLAVPIVGLILLIGACRGQGYLFDQRFEEIVLEDGVIEGIRDEEIEIRCYNSVFGIFRRDFPGHDAEEITARLGERYGEKVELVDHQGESEEPGFYICRVRVDDDGGKYLYFAVDNNYWLTENYLYHKMQQDAVQFWDGRRDISFIDWDTNESYGGDEERWSRQEYAKSEDKLVVWCQGRDDIASCAKDITNWIDYALEDVGYGKPETGYHLPDALDTIYIAAGEEQYLLYIPDNTYWKDKDAWEDNLYLIEAELRECLFDAGVWQEEAFDDLEGSGEADSEQ